MGLSEQTQSQGGHLSNEGKTFLDTLPGAFVYLDTREPFTGTVKKITLTDPNRFYDEQGREIVPLFIDKPEPKKDFLRG